MYGCKYRIATPGHGMAWHGVWCLAFDDHIPNDESIFTMNGRMSLGNRDDGSNQHVVPVAARWGVR